MLFSLALALTVSALKPQDPTVGKKVVFDQDFRKHHSIDEKVWFFNDGPVYNHEQETYTKLPAKNAYLTREGLVIEARKDGGRVTSARIESKAAWKYGYFEADCKVPPGRGTWPAFWMLNQRLRTGGVGWPRCGEIDIMENVGYEPSKFHFSLHSDKYNWQKKEQRTFIVESKNPLEFHKFGLDWAADHITFYLDRKPVYTVKKTEDTVEAWPFNEPFYMILNLAIGGDWGGSKGVDDKIFPSRFVFRSVRIYQ